jgi:hypothetical protein
MAHWFSFSVSDTAGLAADSAVASPASASAGTGEEVTFFITHLSVKIAADLPASTDYLRFTSGFSAGIAAGSHAGTGGITFSCFSILAVDLGSLSPSSVKEKNLLPPWTEALFLLHSRPVTLSCSKAPSWMLLVSSRMQRSDSKKQVHYS